MLTDEFIQDFVDEAKTHIQEIENAFLDKEKLKSSDDLINNVFRAVHSIKGTAGFFGLDHIVLLAHDTENLLGLIRSKKMSLSENVLDCLLASNDLLKKMIEDIAESDKVDISKQIELIKLVMSGENEPPIQAASEPPKSIDSIEEIKKPDIRPVPSAPKIEIPSKTVVEKAEKPVASVGDFIVREKYFPILEKQVKQGHKIYGIKVNYSEGFSYYNEPEHFFADISSISFIVDISIEDSSYNKVSDALSKLKNLKNCSLDILVTSVLELSLFILGVNIDPKCISHIKFETVKKSQSSTVTTDASSKKFNHSETIRVNVELLESLMALSGEMILARNQLLNAFNNDEYLLKAPERVNMSRILQNVDVLTSKMQEKIVLTRMQPIGNVFNKFPRIIRELSKSLKKDIELIIEGKEVELDKYMVEALYDPITHLVRNAADHGLEEPSTRENLGKNSTGCITLRAYYKGSSIVVDVSDDGRGLNISSIKEKAIQKGFISKEAAENVTESELFKYIFMPGFSTSESVTDMSGRGVGMDVVKSNVERMGGSVSLESIQGMGTTFHLILPRTLALMKTLTVVSSGQRFAIPQTNIRYVVSLTEKGNHIEYIHKSKELRLRGELVPIINLSDVLDLTSNDELGTKVVILKVGNKQFGLLVEQVLDTQEILVKPLPLALKNCISYSGVTIMGDGRITMILDVEGIIKKSGINFEAINDKGIKKAPKIQVEYQNMILFKCSGNETYALDMNLVSRVETIMASQVESVGEKLYVKIKQRSIRVIRPEDYLPVSKEKYYKDKLTLIMPNIKDLNVGILVSNVVDNVRHSFELDTEQFPVKGIFGTTVFKNKIILVINIYELMEMCDDRHAFKLHVAENVKKSVLLVEDTAFFRQVESKYLESAGCTVTCAENGRQALAIIKDKHFDLIVSDLIMPVMNGIEFIDEVKKDDSLKHIPSIAVSSMTSDAYKVLALEKGFDAFESKLSKESLIKTINSVLGLKKEEDE